MKGCHLKIKSFYEKCFENEAQNKPIRLRWSLRSWKASFLGFPAFSDTISTDHHKFHPNSIFLGYLCGLLIFVVPSSWAQNLSGSIFLGPLLLLRMTVNELRCQMSGTLHSQKDSFLPWEDEIPRNLAFCGSKRWVQLRQIKHF